MRFQQLKREPNAIMRKKLVKSKKSWVVVSSLSIAGGLLMMTAPSYIAKADVASTSVNTSLTSPAASSTDTTSSDDSKATSAITESVPTTTDSSTEKSTAQSAAPSTVASGSVNKGTEEPTDTTTSTTSEPNDAASSVKVDSTLEKNPVSADYLTETNTNSANSTVKAPTTAEGEETTVTDKPTDSTATDTTSIKEATTIEPSSTLTNYKLMAMAPASATLADNALATEAVAAPATPVAESAPVTTDSGAGWNYDSTNTTLNITGSLDDFKGGDTEHWGGNTSSITTVKVTAPVTAPTDSSYMFANMTNLTSVDIANFDTSNTTNMQGMFKNDAKITNIDLSSNILNAVTDISHMFENDTSLTNVDIASGVASTDTRPGKPFKKLTDASYAFANDINLTNMDSLKSWQGWYLTDLSGMFKNDAKIKTLNLSNLMWTMMGGRPNTGDSSVGEGMFDGTDLQSITLSAALSFSPNTALTSTSGGQWTSNVGDRSGKTFSFLGVPLIDSSGNATSGIGSLYTGTSVSNDISLAYTATKVSNGTTVSNLITINTNHGPISFIAQGTVGQSSTINVPDTFKFEDGNVYTRTSEPTVQVTFDQTQATAPGEATYVGALISDGTATISTNDGDKVINDISGHVGDTVDITVPTKTGYTPDKTTVPGVIQPDGSVKITDTVTYTGNDTTAPVTISSNKGDVTVPNVNGKVGDTVTVTVPTKTGYTPDKTTVQAIINPDGSITTTDTVTYTGNPITNGTATIASNLGNQEVNNISGNVDGTVTVTVPTKPGYTPDKTTVSGVIQPDGSVKVTDTVTYTGDPITNGTATITTNDGDKTVTGVDGKVGDTVTITVPTKTGYTPDKTTVTGVIQPDGSVKVTDTVNYSGNPITDGTATISTNDGDKTVTGLSGKVGDTVTITVPTKTGYTPDKTTVSGVIQPDGSVKVTDTVNYSGNPITDGTATISTNDGDKTVTGLFGNVGDTVTVDVPTKTGYTPDKTTVSGVIQPDGSVKVTETVNYSGNPITDGTATISTNDGDKTVPGFSGKVGDTVTVNVPAKAGYTPDKTTVSGVIQPDGSVKVTETVNYTGNPITDGTATISTNDGDKTVTGLSGKVGDTVTVDVPTKTGYTPDKTTVTGVIQPDGSVKVTENVNYTGNPIADGTATISTNDGDKTVTGLSGNVGDTVTVDVPTKTGYTPDKTTVSGVIQPDGSVKVTETVNYTGNPITDGTATISTNDGDKTVTGLSGKVGDTVTVDVPTKTGYTPDKTTVTGVIQPDGSVKVTENVNYTGNPIADGTATISTNDGDKTVTGLSGNVGDTITVTVPTKTGYTPDKTTVQATINPDGSITPNENVTYIGNKTTAPVTISTNQGNVTVPNVNGKVGDTVTVNVPTKTGYTPDKTTVQATINPDGSITTDESVTYTGNDTTAPVTIPTNKGDVTVSDINGKVGDIVTVDVPAKTGYTPDKTTVQATINPDGSITTDENVTYTGNDTTAPVTISTNKGDVTVSDINGKVGDIVTVDVPAKTGYTPDKTTVQATINPDGSITTDENVTYSGNKTTAPVTIPTNKGDVTVSDINGKVGDTVTVDVPAKTGYTPDKTTVQATINPDGSITTDETVTYTGNDTTAPVTISTNKGDVTVSDINGKVGDIITVDVPTKTGYIPDKTTIQATINPDGSITPNESVTYTGVTNPAQTLTIKNPDGTTSDFTIPEGKYGDEPKTVTANEISGYIAPSVIVTYNFDGTPTITDAKDSTKTITNNDVLSYIRKSSGSSNTVKPVNPNDGVIEQKVQTISTYSDKPEVELYQLSSDNKMAQIANRALATASNWYSDATITVDGISYYRVATNEWAKMSQAYPYQALNLHIRTYNDSEKALYKAENIIISNETLAPSSSWITDRETYVINNTKYYRVATNEFVNADDVYVYSPVNMVVTTHADKYTTLYTAKGAEVTNRTLSNDSSWKVDSITYINGDKYYRVATNEFVKASDVDIRNYR